MLDKIKTLNENQSAPELKAIFTLHHSVTSLKIEANKAADYPFLHGNVKDGIGTGIGKDGIGIVDFMVIS